MSLFEPKKVLVAGDFMLDAYTLGEVQRISPEAPVPILRVTEESSRPGGAGNAVLNLISLGMEVSVIGRLGTDAAGDAVLEAMEGEGVHLNGMFRDPQFRTPVKNRMIAQGQQILRIDYERPTPLTSSQEVAINHKLPQLLEGIDVVAISDYGKGLLTPAFLAALILECRKREIPVVVDPKGRDFKRYRGATLIKPNLSEAIAAAGLVETASLDEVAAHILKETLIEVLMITRSKEGISIFDGVKRQDFPTQVHEVKDVTGAGDTVLAVICAALANGLELSDAAKLANVAAAIAIERIGCARISIADLSARLIDIGYELV